jgi:hypothetical protein
MSNRKPSEKPAAGQIWRDTYYDKDTAPSKRTIRLVLFYPVTGKWDAVTETDRFGSVEYRKTKVSNKTLMSGYELVKSHDH